MISLVVHVADIRTCVLHSASSTHRQLTDAQLRRSRHHAWHGTAFRGVEHIDDILADLEQALAYV